MSKKAGFEVERVAAPEVRDAARGALAAVRTRPMAALGLA